MGAVAAAAVPGPRLRGIPFAGPSAAAAAARAWHSGGQPSSFGSGTGTAVAVAAAAAAVSSAASSVVLIAVAAAAACKDPSLMAGKSDFVGL